VPISATSFKASYEPFVFSRCDTWVLKHHRSLPVDKHISSPGAVYHSRQSSDPGWSSLARCVSLTELQRSISLQTGRCNS